MSPRVVVVGAGTAGIPAALAALDAGADVVLVEKGHTVGGVLWVSGGLTSGADSRLQRAKGIDDSAESHFADVQRIGRGRANEPVLQLVTANAGATIDWFEDIGATFTDDSPMLAGFELYDVPRTYALEAPADVGPWKGRVLAQLLADELERRADDPRLRLIMRTTVVELRHDGRGVTGCQLRGPDGVEDVEADAVILATGGYAANRELVRRLHPGYDGLITLSLPHATGDGIVLAGRVGGRVVNDDIVLPNPGGIEDPERPGYRLEGGALAVGRPPAAAGDIWVNRKGERFIAEDEPSQAVRERATAEQPDAVMVAVFDEPMRRGLVSAVAEWTEKKLSDPRLIVSAPTIAELAERAGLPPAALEQTVESYNRGVAARADRLGRVALPAPIEAPPFHAVETRGVLIMTFAGLAVNGRLEVLDPDRTAIPGLYAAGELLGAGQLQGAGYSSGMMIVSAVTTGRIAALNAVGGRVSA